MNRVRVLESGPHTPTQFFCEYPPPGPEHHRPITTSAGPPKRTQKSLRWKLVPIPLIVSVVETMPFRSWFKPLFQSEANCESIDMKWFFYSHANKSHVLHKSGFALGFGLRKSLNKNDRDQVLWARETEHPIETLVSLKPLDTATWLRSLLSKVHLVLKFRVFGTRKWPIIARLISLNKQDS